MRQPVTQQENGHGAMTRDAINALAAVLREAMQASGEDSHANMVWLALASWLRNNSMMPVVLALGRGQRFSQPLLAGGQTYILSIAQAAPPAHQMTLRRTSDGKTWQV